MKKKKQGFTLIEIMIVLAISGIVLGIISSIFITSNKVFSDSDVKSSLQIEAQFIQEKLSNIGMEGVGIYSITDNQGREIIEIDSESIPIVDLDYNKLKLKSTDEDGNISNINSEKSWLPIIKMEIYPVKENQYGEAIKGEPIELFKYENGSNSRLNDGKIIVNNSELSENIKDIKINILQDNTPLKNSNSILLRITLHKKKGFSNITYPFFVNIKFRNGFIKNS